MARIAGWDVRKGYGDKMKSVLFLSEEKAQQFKDEQGADKIVPVLVDEDTGKIVGTEFHIPQIPYSPIDAHNRSAAAKGSPRYAQLTSHANYNGHHVTVAWNDYRRYYTCEYFWAGRIVLARGSFADCLRAALANQASGALGSSASIYTREDDAEAIALCESTPQLERGSAWVPDGQMRKLREESWWTWRHSVGAESAKDMANPRCPVLIFNWDLLQAADTREQYEQALQAKYGRAYA